jgi:hypothetical protein
MSTEFDHLQLRHTKRYDCGGRMLVGFVVSVKGGPQDLLFREDAVTALADGAAYVAKYYPEWAGA